MVNLIIHNLQHFILQDEWIFFTYPLDYLGVRTDIDLECSGTNFRSSHPELSPTGSLEIIPENCPLDPSGRLSISLDTDNCLLDIDTCPTDHVTSPTRDKHVDTMGVRSSTLDTRRGRHPYSEAKSYACLPQVRITL